MAKSETNRFRTLDVRKLQRCGFLDQGESGIAYFNDRRFGPESVRIDAHLGYIMLSYQVRGEEIRSPVPLDWVKCHLGGQRPWFICPNPECRRRVAILYGNKVFACRHCHRLAYECQKETDDVRALRRANKIRHRLGWQPGTLTPPGWHVDPAWTWYKPKGMHRLTYCRLLNEHNVFAMDAINGMGERLGILQKKVRRLTSSNRSLSG